MRFFTVLCLVLLLAALAVGQTVVNGTVTSGPYGFYSAPFVPRIVTPSVSLSTVSPSPVGASNATYGNVAGATNATLSIQTPPPVGVFTQPVFYDESSDTTPAVYVQGPPPRPMQGHHGMSRYADYGVATFDSDISAMQLMAPKGSWKKASRTYTNADIDRFNQSTGNVKYDGKTEQIK
jgi:hypothetical protein